jgi:hypothetical protein
MKHLKLFENFKQEDIEEFRDFIEDKLLELSDLNFSVKVKNIENIVHISILSKIKDKYGNTQPFKFSEVADIIEDILLSNNEWLKNEPLYKKIHFFVRIAGVVYIIKGYEQRTENKGERGERISFSFIDGKIQWSFENSFSYRRSKEDNLLNLDCKQVELFFE